MKSRILKNGKMQYYCMFPVGRDPLSGKIVYRQITSTRSEYDLTEKILHLAGTNAIMPVKTNLTISECAENLLKEGKSPYSHLNASEKKQILQDIHNFIGDVSIADLDAIFAENIIKNIESSDISASRKQRTVAFLRTISRHLYACRVLSEDIFYKLTIHCSEKQKKRILDKNALSAILSLNPNDVTEACLMGIYYCGARPSEELAIEWGDIGWDTGSVTIKGQLRKVKQQKTWSLEVTKTTRIRTIYPGNEFFTLMLHVKEQQEKWKQKSEFQKKCDADLCFLDEMGNPLSLSHLLERMRSVLAGTEFENEDLRILRRTRVTNIYFDDRYGGKGRAMAISGHTEWKDTLRNYIVVDNDKREQLRTADNRFYESLLEN